MNNVIENLVKMKKLTETMVTLAYSDLFYDDTDMQKELDEIHQEIKVLENENLKHIFKIRESDELRIKMIELMEYVKDISNACKNMSVLNSEGRVLPFPDKLINDSEERAMILNVSKKSVLVDKKIGESKVRTIMKVSIKGLKRNNKWNFNVNKDTVIRAGDVVYALGSVDGKKIFTKIVEGTLKSVY